MLPGLKHPVKKHLWRISARTWIFFHRHSTVSVRESRKIPGSQVSNIGIRWWCCGPCTTYTIVYAGGAVAFVSHTILGYTLMVLRSLHHIHYSICWWCFGILPTYFIVHMLMMMRDYSTVRIAGIFHPWITSHCTILAKPSHRVSCDMYQCCKSLI